MKRNKKMRVALFCAALLFLLTACARTTPDQTEQKPAAAGADASANEETHQTATVDTMEKMVDIDGVLSVTMQAFSQQIDGAVAYKVLYENANGKLAADVVLPRDYAEETHTVLLYFPEVGINIDALAQLYVSRGLIVVRPYARGYDASEGVRDFGGARDLADAQTLLSIFDQTDFIARSKVFVAGSSEGSVNALRLFAADAEDRISGCAVVDAVTDLHAFGIARGENVQNLLAALIGSTYDDAPEEYALRSAVTFSDRLDGPILMLHYTRNANFPVEQTDGLYDLLKDRSDCAYRKIDVVASDFMGEGLQCLLAWIDLYD